MTDSTTAQARWQRDVAAYDRPHLRLRQVATLVNRLQPARWADLGCGPGQLRRLCPGGEYMGCDFVETPGAPGPFHRCDLNREPLPPELRELSLVVGSGFLEYLVSLPEFLAQLPARLLPGGHLITTYFNMNHLSRVLALVRGESFTVHPDWRGFYSPRAVRTLLEKAGFEVLEQYAVSHGRRPSPAIAATVEMPLRMEPYRAWSPLLAHQVIYLARVR